MTQLVKKGKKGNPKKIAFFGKRAGGLKMKKYFCIILLFAVGCASSSALSIQAVSQSYETIIFNDGINAEEAKIIGQRELIKQNLVKLYDIADPRIITNVTDLPNHEKYWFVSFKEIKTSHIQYIFMSIINRNNGQVRFSDDFKEDKRWILEAALLGG